MSGRVEDDGTYTTISCHVQKIFKLEGHGHHLTWAVTGNVDLESSVNLIAIIGQCARHLLASDAQNLDALAARIGGCVNDAMHKAKEEGKFSLYPTNNGSEILKLFIQGYYKEQAAQCVLTMGVRFEIHRAL